MNNPIFYNPPLKTGGKWSSPSLLCFLVHHRYNKKGTIDYNLFIIIVVFNDGDTVRGLGVYHGGELVELGPEL